MKEPVSVEGIWLRRLGDDIQVLAEVDGVWRLVITEFYDRNISHIVEPSGIRKGASIVV